MLGNLIPVLGREGDVHVGVCAHMDVPSYGCGLEELGFESLMWHDHACQGNSETAFLTLIILYASNFSTISDPYQCFSSFHDTRAEIIMVEPERIMLQKPSHCYQWIFVLLQPTEIMV